jgi:aminoglycoside phosphotransferase (APT) family kinase protein
MEAEMSTVGDPLMDLAVLVAYAQEAASSPHGNPDAAFTARGFPSPSELAEAYALHSGWHGDGFDAVADRVPWLIEARLTAIAS